MCDMSEELQILPHGKCWAGFVCFLPFSPYLSDLGEDQGWGLAMLQCEARLLLLPASPEDSH